MNYREAYQSWLNDKYFDESTRAELSAITDSKEIEDRFYCDLKFGTGGLRGIMGAGTNRINKYTVGKATTGLGNYLLDIYGASECLERGVVIGYDTRNNSKDLARIVANILSRMEIKVYLHSEARPTPQLSFSVKYYRAIAGVVITASHNTKEYNGYKVYDEYGCQLVPHQAKQVISYIDAIKDYSTISFAGNEDLITVCDITDEFIEAVIKQSRFSGDKNIKIVYTPLHGSGLIPIQKCLKKTGFSHVELVQEQAIQDGDFPTLISPNPEDRRALEMGIVQAEKSDADIVIGTDPDCDRVGVAVKTKEGFKLITGNQMGALLLDFVLSNTELRKNDAIIKTVVTSELGAEIARKKGVKVFTTLTGFKFIGEKITQFEIGTDEQKKNNFIFGYEESYGYLAGTHARDKDAVVSTLLICEMAAKLKTEGKTLFDRMNELYTEYGFYCDAQDSFTFEGKEGLERIAEMMKLLRDEGSPFKEIEKVIDYSVAVPAEEGFGELPISNVLKYILSDGSWIAIRPSGTEPKIKIYYSMKADSEKVAKKKLIEYQEVIRTMFGV